VYNTVTQGSGAAAAGSHSGEDQKRGQSSGGQAPVPAERVLAIATPVAPDAMAPGRELSDKQVIVLEKLSIAKSITDAAQAADVSRNTIYRWCNEDPVFRAAYNRLKRVCSQSVETRLLALMDLAVDIIREQLEVKRDGRLAMKLLERLNMIKPVHMQATDVESSAREIEAENLVAKARLERYVEEAKGVAEGEKKETRET
jgi:hypothetical protein